ncbi:MAG: hypothetical protein ACTSWL_06375 [Promethearchaeota archaeon]
MNTSVITHNMFIFIPSWQKLLGYPPLGKYLNKDILHIDSDPVVFFVRAESTIVTEFRKLHFIFGIGYYFVNFEIDEGVYTSIKKKLTGMVISDFVYNYLKRSNDITLEDDMDVLIKEDIVKVPLDLSKKTEKQLSFIDGALMHNVYLPQKKIILEMLNSIKNQDLYQIKNTGHQLLSTFRLHYNEILVSDQMHQDLYSSYFVDAPGLNGVNFGADQLLRTYFMPTDLKEIENQISKMEVAFRYLQYDPMSLFSILQNAKIVLETNSPDFFKQLEQNPTIKDGNFLFSANYSTGTVIEWPKEFNRAEKEKEKEKELEQKHEIEHISETKVNKERKIDLKNFESYSYKKALDEAKLDNYKGGPVEREEKFELDQLKRKKLSFKQVPPIPDGDLEEIITYLKKIVEEGYNSRQISEICESVHDKIQKMVFHSDFNWELSKQANYYHKQDPDLGLNERDKRDFISKLNEWIDSIKQEKKNKNEQIEREKLMKKQMEQALLEEKQLVIKKKEQERLEKEQKEDERLGKEKKEEDRLEKERKEQERLGKEQIVQKRLEKEQIEQERLEKEQIEQERLEKEQIKHERLEKEQKEPERLEKEQKEPERLEKEQKEPERLEKEQKEPERLEKERKENERLKIEKERRVREKAKSISYETEKLNNLLNEIASIKKRMQEMKINSKKLEKEAKILKKKIKKMQKM